MIQPSTQFPDAVKRLIESVEFDVNGSSGQGGNGGLISDKTIRAAGELRILLSRLPTPEPIPHDYDHPDGAFQKAAAGTNYLGFAVESVLFRGRRATIVDRDVPIGTAITTASSLSPTLSMPAHTDDLPIFAEGGLGSQLLMAFERWAGDYVFSPDDDFADHHLSADEKAMLIDFINGAFAQGSISRILQDAAKAALPPTTSHRCPCGDDDGLWCSLPGCPFPNTNSASTPPPQHHVGLTISALQAAHVARQEEWCPDQKPDLSFRGNELGGECGEAQNVIKKLERERHGWRGSRDTVEHLGEELADVIHCAILCAITAGIDLEPAVVAKFNTTSEKNGLASILATAAEGRNDG